LISTPVRIGLVGDRDPQVTAHRAIPLALARAAETLQIALEVDWLATDQISSTAGLASFHGLWCVPASPYRSTEGALRAIGHARESGLPFLGTCGGFQHAVLEYARNVLAWVDAEHGELAPAGARQVIAPLSCALVEVAEEVRFVPGTRLAAAYGAPSAREGYHCRYGMNPQFESELLKGSLRAAAYDGASQLRAVELNEHPFFVATLFQPERAALQDRDVPLARAFLAASAVMRG